MAHDLNKKWRSADVQLDEEVDFTSLLLSKSVLKGLKNAGFVRPSPIQLQAIPLGRCGLDLIVQAKSGTGKTCVFGVIALEGLLLTASATQVLVLAPTREIAVQICDVVKAIGTGFTNLSCHAFIGGLNLADDREKLKNCHIAIGTPGRIKHLIGLEALKTNSVRLFVLDEADKLLEESFKECINWIYSKLPTNKQMLALSATYPEALAELLKQYMRNPFYIRLNANQPALIGIKQFYKPTQFHPIPQVTFQNKIEALLKLLVSVSFSQCLVFSNYQSRAESLCDMLSKANWPTTYISGSQEQSQRLNAMAKLKAFQCRILVSTDLTSRGIDAENVNLVVNMDVPLNVETYLHRIGRAGRFGSQGLSVTFLSGEKETEQFKKNTLEGRLQIFPIPDQLPDDLWSYTPEAFSEESISSLTTMNSIDSNTISLEPQTQSLEPPNEKIDDQPLQVEDLNFDWLRKQKPASTISSFEELQKNYNDFMESETEVISPQEVVRNNFPVEMDSIVTYLKDTRTKFYTSIKTNTSDSKCSEKIDELMKDINSMFISKPKDKPKIKSDYSDLSAETEALNLQKDQNLKTDISLEKELVQEMFCKSEITEAAIDKNHTVRASTSNSPKESSTKSTGSETNSEEAYLASLENGNIPDEIEPEQILDLNAVQSSCAVGGREESPPLYMFNPDISSEDENCNQARGGSEIFELSSNENETASYQPCNCNLQSQDFARRGMWNQMNPVMQRAYQGYTAYMAHMLNWHRQQQQRH